MKIEIELEDREYNFIDKIHALTGDSYGKIIANFIKLAIVNFKEYEKSGMQ